jgi:transposase
MPCEEVTSDFAISLPSIKRCPKRRRETGEVDPKPIPGPPATKGAMLQEWLLDHLQRNPDFTLKQHCNAFEEERGINARTTLSVVDCN